MPSPSCWSGVGRFRYSCFPPRAGNASRRALRGDLDLDLVSLDPHLETVNSLVTVIAPDAVMEAKTPRMIGAGNHAVFEHARGERRTHVWTAIVHRVELSGIIEDRDHAARDLKGFAVPFRNLPHFCYCRIITHVLAVRSIATVSLPTLRCVGRVSQSQVELWK
jgi:hypothetical protein